MKKHIILLSAAGLLFSSCGVYTKYKPATEVPDGLYGEETAAFTESTDGSPVATEDSLNRGLGGMDWRELFTDPHLQALIGQGLQNNTDYQSAQLRVEEAEATLLSAKLAFLPSFALAPQGTVSSFDSHKATQTYSLPVTASWELDIFGRMRNAKKQSKALYAQSRDYRQAVRTQLIAGIANTYYTLLMLDEQLAISRQTEETWKETVASTRALMNAGMADESAVSQMEAAYYQVQASVLDLEEQINQVENSLALLLAETPRRYERGVLAEQQFPADFSIGIPVRMLSCRPDVRSAERTLEAAFYGTNAARSAFYPSITLGPCPARRGLPCLPADIAECRQRGKRRLDCLADKPFQKRTAGQAGSFLADGCPQHFPADGTWQHHLSGSAYRPAKLAQCATVADGQPIL